MHHARVASSRPELRAVVLPLACILATFGCLSWLTSPEFIPRFYFRQQDSFVLAGLVILLLVFSSVRTAIPVPDFSKVSLTTRKVLVGCAVAAIVLWLGTYLLFQNYPLARDEQLVLFDMDIFRHGRLAAPLPSEWRRYADALTPSFLLLLRGNADWVSDYMPGNAMLRTLFSSVLDPALMNPLLAALGAAATFDCARRLFPEDRGAQSIALLMYGTSAQVLLTAMTPYAMTGHLALNMIWLSFYLRKTRIGHTAAIAIGFVAIGLHQIIFHPLFAVPFIDQLRRDGQWRTAVAYVLCYALFGLFWISYPHLVALSAGLTSKTGYTSGASAFFAVRVLPLLTVREPQTIGLMEVNLLRFVTWENLALVPLMILGLGAVRRSEGLARPLMAGVLLTVFAMTILLPYQAMGWGYRYLHGLIGNCALLAAYGWHDFSKRAEVRSFVTVATLATLLGSIPFLTWEATAFLAPYARVDRMIDNINADMVVVSTYGTSFRIDEVRNPPDLNKRPIRLADNVLTPNDIQILCARGTIAFLDARKMQQLGLGFGQMPSQAHFEELRQAAPNSCRRPI